MNTVCLGYVIRVWTYKLENDTVMGDAVTTVGWVEFPGNTAGTVPSAGYYLGNGNASAVIPLERYYRGDYRSSAVLHGLPELRKQ